MEAAGCEAWYSVESLAVRGVVEVLRHLPRLFCMRRHLRVRLLRARVSLFIGVDAPDFNFGLEKKLKRRGVRTIHFVSPSVWAWRGERLKKIGRAVNRMLALFPFEPALYEAEGIPVTFVGHPMAADAATHATRRETRELLKLKAATPVFALLPGSRLSEIEMHAELVLADSGAHFRGARRCAFPRPVRHPGDARRIRGRDAPPKAATNLPITLLYGHAEDALRAADVGIVASGTATLEAALARCPHVIFYRVSALTGRIVGRRLLLPYVGLPNVLAGGFVVPEFLQDDATPDNLAQAALNLFDDTVTRRRLEALFAGFAAQLSADTGTLAASAVLAELRLAGAAC